MKAVVYRHYGGPEVLEYADVPDPKLSQNSLLVRARALAPDGIDALLDCVGKGVLHATAEVGSSRLAQVRSRTADRGSRPFSRARTRRS